MVSKNGDDKSGSSSKRKFSTTCSLYGFSLNQINSRSHSLIHFLNHKLSDYSLICGYFLTPFCGRMEHCQITVVKYDAEMVWHYSNHLSKIPVS